MKADAPDSVRRNSVVRLAGVERIFPGFPEVHALQPVSLEVFEGDFLMIVGPSGSGKSTFLNVLGLLDRPSSGNYLLGGRDVSALSEPERAAERGHHIGFVFQALQLMEGRTAFENVLLATAYQGLSFRQSESQVRRALESVGLSSKLDTVVSRLSGGERQRVAIARALAGNPTLLLCDEPTGNLDTATSDEVMDLLLELNRGGATIVLITHNPAIAAMGNRQARIADGVMSEVSSA